MYLDKSLPGNMLVFSKSPSPALLVGYERDEDGFVWIWYLRNGTLIPTTTSSWYEMSKMTFFVQEP